MDTRPGQPCDTQFCLRQPIHKYRRRWLLSLTHRQPPKSQLPTLLISTSYFTVTTRGDSGEDRNKTKERKKGESKRKTNELLQPSASGRCATFPRLSTTRGLPEGRIPTDRVPCARGIPTARVSTTTGISSTGLPSALCSSVWPATSSSSAEPGP